MMRDWDLATVLLVKAFEDQDRDGTLLPAADRESAAREAARSLAIAEGGGPVPESTQLRLLVARAHILFARIAARHPVVESIRTHSGSPRWLYILLALAGLAAGIAISALDEPRRIEVVLSPALMIFLGWNVLVYAWLIFASHFDFI